jgi:hypothetical protein
MTSDDPQSQFANANSLTRVNRLHRSLSLQRCCYLRALFPSTDTDYPEVMSSLARVRHVHASTRRGAFIIFFGVRASARTV